MGFTLLSGCASRNTRKTASLSHAKNVKASAAELSSRNQSLLALYSAEIESAADQIIAGSPDPGVRREALAWKAEMIPILQTSLLKTDPLAAVVDTWAFLFQASAYMERPTERKKLGTFAVVPSNALKQMETELEQLIISAAPSADMDKLRQTVTEWADAHPIQVSLSGRQSVDADVIRRTRQDDLGSLASLKALEEGLGDVTARLDSYNSYLPKQIRWQAELLVGDLANDRTFNATAHNFTVLTKALDKTSNNLDRMPALAARARDVAVKDVDNQRLSLQSFLRQERIQVIDDLTEQRVAATADLHAERLAATADLRRERQIVLDAIDQERIASMNDLQTLRKQATDDLELRSRRLIDHLFWRAIEFMLVALLLSSLAVWVLMRRYSSRNLPTRDHYNRAA